MGRGMNFQLKAKLLDVSSLPIRTRACLRLLSYKRGGEELARASRACVYSKEAHGTWIMSGI